ncbi:hypothetical protein JCM8547_004301 [Rhodosporidiobolus lusitaniae]
MSASPPRQRVKTERQAASRARPRSSIAHDDSPTHSSDDGAHPAKRVKTEPKGKGKRKVVVQDDEYEEGDANGASGDEDDEEEQVEQEEEEVDFSHEKQQLVRDDSGYVTGSIVRIACHSFLTYDFVEFRPGPALNMIIGPNGTGKSTIACAIAIGLGFPAKVLGRSTKLSQYCKNDSEAATWIEIELKGKPGKKNLIIKRHLSRDSEKTTFEVNGKDKSAKDVQEYMEELQVQIGNLCTFLPQDRVASFAMMSPAELLRETQKAAGHPQLSQWHDVLIKEYKLSRESQGEVDRYAEKLRRLQTKQAEQEKEVRAFAQREKLEQDLAVLDNLVKFAQYEDVFTRHGFAKQQKTVVTNEVQELEAKNRPFTESKDRLKEILKASEKEVESLRKKVDTAMKDAAAKKGSIDKLNDDRDKVSRAIQDIKEEEKARKEAIRKAEKEIAKLQPLVDNEPPEADTEDISRQISQKGRERNEIAVQLNANNDEVTNIRERAGRLKVDYQRCEQQKARLMEVSGQREAACARWELDAWNAVLWLRANKDKMRGQVFEPARLNVFPKKELRGQKLDLRPPPSDQRVQAAPSHLDLIEAPIPMHAFSNFLFEFREDYDFMFSELHDKPLAAGGKPIRFNGTEINLQRTMADVPRAFSEQQLDELGFDAFSIDLVEGAEPVLVWLCDTHHLNKVPVQLFRREVQSQAVERSGRVQRYFTFDGSYSIKMAQYGRRQAQVEQRSLSSPKVLSGGVDTDRVKVVEDQMKELYQERTQLKERMEKLTATEQDFQAQIAQIEQERNELQAEKERMQKDRAMWFKAKTKYSTYQKNRDRELAKPSADEKRGRLNERLTSIMEKRVKYALEYKDFVDRADSKQAQSIKIHLQALQADSDYRAMEAMVRDKDEELDAKRKELEEIKLTVSALSKEGKALLAMATEAQDEASEDVRDRVMERRNEKTEALVDLENERDEVQSNLNCMQSVSPVVLEAYNKRKGEIAEQEGKLNTAQESLDNSNGIINKTKAKWLPRLEHLISDVSAKFTASFDTLGLLGEVRLAQHDDYEKWGIEIMVSFRDIKDDTADVTLHVLSGHRQSGGERALTTVTYLLALAELARAPFALVDEINQGMDQRAERNMHKMLVETTCKDDVGQYFLLTPKLLPDLVYHPKMKVLVINVSPWLPDALNLSDIVKQKRALLAKAVAGGA